MPEVDEAAILKRAKKLCKQDGAVWDSGDLEFKPAQPIGSKIVPTPLLNDEERRKYLARAREQFIKERGDGE